MYNYVEYDPYEERALDTQYKNLLRRIIEEGEWYQNQMEEPAKTLFGVQLDFNLANGAPIITERDIVTSSKKTGRSYVSQAFGEIIGFLNGARTQEQLESYGCYWWKNWVNEAKTSKRGLKTGDLGDGSYGPAWTNFPTNSGDGFNQITAVVEQIKQRPHLRTHRISNWIPQFVYRIDGSVQKVVVVPCHGDLLIRINVDTGGLTLINNQRSADVPVGLPANLAGYTAFILIIASVTGYRAERLIFMIQDAHIYERQLGHVQRMLETEDGVFPTVILSANHGKITDYRNSDFSISDYHPKGPRMLIPTPV